MCLHKNTDVGNFHGFGRYLYCLDCREVVGCGTPEQNMYVPAWLEYAVNVERENGMLKTKLHSVENALHYAEYALLETQKTGYGYRVAMEGQCSIISALRDEVNVLRGESGVATDQKKSSRGWWYRLLSYAYSKNISDK